MHCEKMVIMGSNKCTIQWETSELGVTVAIWSADIDSQGFFSSVVEVFLGGRAVVGLV